MKAAQELLDAYAAGVRKGYKGTGLYPQWIGVEPKREYLGISGAGNCSRQMWFSIHPSFDRPEPDMVALALFADGYLLEADTAERLEAGGLPVVEAGMEIVHPFAPRIKGHIDGLVGFADGVALFEHKAMRPYPFAKLIGEKRGTAPQNVAEEHEAGYILSPGSLASTNPHYLAQVLGYLRVYEMMHPVDAVARALFVARSKETAKLAVEEILPDLVRGDEIVERMKSVLHDLDGEVISSKDYDPKGKDWQCQYCDYRAACLDTGEDTKMPRLP